MFRIFFGKDGDADTFTKTNIIKMVAGPFLGGSATKHRDFDEAQLQTLLLEGSECFGLEINGKKVLDNRGGYQGWGTTQNLNNAFYDLLKKGEGAMRFINGSSKDRYDRILSFKRSNNKVVFSTIEVNQHSPETAIRNEECALEQAVEEVIAAVTYYRNTWADIVRTLAPGKEAEMMKFIFEPWVPLQKDVLSLSHDERDAANVWLPLETIWKEYKK